MIGARIHGELRVERELGAVGQVHFARREPIDADLRTLQVAEHAHVAARHLGGLPDEFETPRVIGWCRRARN